MSAGMVLALNEGLPDDRFERAMFLMNMMISHATQGESDDAAYGTLRREFMGDPETKDLLPSYVRTCRDLDAFWPVAKAMSAKWEGRRVQIRQDFNPLLDCLERDGGSPLDAVASEALSAFNPEDVHAVWTKALARRQQDPEGAITMARTLLETVLKHVLLDAGESFEEADDLPKLYRSVAELLNLAPSQHTEDIFRRVLGGCTQVVEGLGSIRNKIGDAHGKGPRPVRPSERHAALVVNLAGTMATFVVETYAAKRGAKAAVP